MKTDQFDGFTTLESASARVKSDHSGMYYFRLQKFTQKGTDSYSLGMFYLGDEWMFIEPGQSLTFLIDGERVGLSAPEEKMHHDTRGATAVEVASYPIDTALVVKLAGATSLQAKLSGKRFNAVLTSIPDNTPCIVARFAGEAFRGEQHLSQ